MVGEVTRAHLIPDALGKARWGEIKYCEPWKIARKVEISKCIEVIGKKPSGVRWMDHKGHEHNPNIRCRLVAQEVGNV